MVGKEVQKGNKKLNLARPLRSKKLVKGGTKTTKKHRFESFNQRISKLSIDPLRRRHTRIQDVDPTDSIPFFRTSLDRWKDLNLTENFTAFVGKVNNLCNTHPQLLHHKDRIFDMLLLHIGRKDSLSLEPLLDLLSNFAHDLDVRFEDCYERAVTMVVSMAAELTDPEAIEYCFTCLAWLFKYLSRLLVPNLRPTFRIMATFLGKAPQNPYIMRFTAEAMSFLLRKAATMYPRDERPLRLILETIQEDLVATGASRDDRAQLELYKEGLSTLFLFSMKSVERKLHSCSVYLYRCMTEVVLLECDRDTSALAEILTGVTVALIHHSDAVGFQPLLAIIIESVEAPPQAHNDHTLVISAQLLFTVSVVRQGSRIDNWNPVLDGALKILTYCDECNASTVTEVYKAVAVTLQNSPLDLVIPRFRMAVKILEKNELESYFLPFCSYFCDLGRERFQNLLLPHFYQFLISKWRGNELHICLVAPKLMMAQGSKAGICLEAWQDTIIDCFERAVVHDNLVLQCFGYLNLLDHVVWSPTTKVKIDNYLFQMIQTTLGSTSIGDMRTLFGIGAALQAYVSSAKLQNGQILDLWLQLCAEAPRFGNIMPYLETILDILRRLANHKIGEEMHQLMDIVIRNLSSISHPLRKISLEILQVFFEKRHHRPAEILSTAWEIELCPLDHSSARTISMYIRKLSSSYAAISTHEWLPKAIVHFCFGLLSYKLSSAKRDAVATLKQICETKIGEELVSYLCFTWLEQYERKFPDAIREQALQQQDQGLTAFQCSNLLQVKKLIDAGSRQITDAEEILRQRFYAVHERHDQQTANAPHLALQVLGSVPWVAEKRSRHLVPMFLSWARDEQAKTADAAAENDISSQISNDHIAAQVWGFRDRKAMLDLFSSFQNPSALYQSSEVFDALRDLLANGDVETQKSALKAIFTWKAKEIQPYQEHLLNLLDEKRFRDELSTFLQIDERDSVIEVDHRDFLMPVLLRLLYGRMVARSGAKSGNSGQPAKRRAVLQALSRLDERYLHMFASIALGDLKDVELLESISSSTSQGNEKFKNHQLKESVISEEMLSAREQVGLINMVKDMLEVLGGILDVCMPVIINAVLYCSIRSNRQLQSLGGHLEGEETAVQQTSLHRTIRQLGLQCVILLFRSCRFQQLEPYTQLVFNEIIKPRLDNLAIETAQSVSGILQLFSTLTLSDEAVSIFCKYDDDEGSTLFSIIQCLEVPSAKDEVKLYVINDILKRIVNLTGAETVEGLITWNGNGTNARRALRPAMRYILERMGGLLKGSPNKELLASAVELVSMLGPLLEGSFEVQDLLEISTFLLEQPSQRVSPKSKGDLLKIIKHFIPLMGSDLSKSMLDHIYRSTASLFGYFKDRSNRLILSEVMTILAAKDEDLRKISKLCVSLNSFSAKRLDEPDFDQRLKTFAVINEEEFQELSPRQWRAILYNMLYFVRDNEELAIRTSAGFCLRRFVDMNPVDAEDLTSESSELVKSILLPALRSGASEPSELVRSEYIGVMAHLIQSNPLWVDVSDMRPLLVEADEEASFFSNILHIQQHRRLRALRRLAAESQQVRFRSANVAHYFVPLIEHFVFDKADDESAHNLSAETVKTIGTLASSLEWPQFRAMFRRYTGYIHSKPDMEKVVIRLLGLIIDSLLVAVQNGGDKGASMGGSDVEMLDLAAVPTVPNTLATTMPEKGKLADDILSNLLPSLIKYVHEKDESTVSLRVPVAISIVKLLSLLPRDKFRERLPAVLTDVCHILRSRAQESRELTRRTLIEISRLIGSEYFGFVLKELRGALARGYQLHVLSFTVHSILVATSDIFKPGALDYCLDQIVAVVMDDIFGATGQEKDAEEYISKMKEVKSSKSYDSMELVARTATVENLVYLIRPLQTLLEERLDLRLVRKIDELLRRIGLGLMRNTSIEDQRVLIFSHEIIRELYKIGGVSIEKTKREDHRTRRYLIQSAAKRPGDRGSTSSHSYKLMRFALDIARAVLQKFDTLRTPSNIAGFIPIIGDAIIHSNEEIQASGLRLLAAIIKVPLKSIDDNAGLYVAECVKIVKSSTSTHVEIAQAALKLVSAILRERRTVEIREADLAYLLKRLAPDLEEPEKQGVAFNFLKAIMARKLVITEVYEIMDVVAVIMVTNQNKTARDMARGAYFYFIMEYPQSKERFSKQSNFLVKNLDYQYPEGRRSVMEAIHQLFNKVGEDLVQDIIASFFVPLVMVIANDESSQCREMAGALLRSCFARADATRTHSFFNLLQAWLDRLDEPLLVRVAIQIYGIYLEVKGRDAEREVPGLQICLSRVLKSNLKDPGTADWELLYFALQTFTKICTLSPASGFASTAGPLWQSIRQCLTFPHAWVKLSSAKILGIYFADFARTNSQKDGTTLPMAGSGGLHLDELETIAITRVSLALLKVPSVGEELAAQSVRNLLFLGKIAAQTSILWPTSQSRTKLATELSEEAKEDEDEGEESSTSTDEPTHRKLYLDSPSTSPPKTLLTHILLTSSHALRQPLPTPSTTTTNTQLTPHTTHLTLLTTLLTAVPLAPIFPHLPTVLLSLSNLTDPNITFPSFSNSNTALKESFAVLRTRAAETMDLVAKRVGVTAYATLMAHVRERVRSRREERRGKRRGEEGLREMERKRRRKGERRKEKGRQGRERRKGIRFE